MFREFLVVAVVLLGISANQYLALENDEELKDFNIGEVANLTVTVSEKVLLYHQNKTLNYYLGERRYRKYLVSALFQFEDT